MKTYRILPDGTKCYSAPNCRKHSVWFKPQSTAATIVPLNKEKLSKTLSYILRHKPETVELTLDLNGWVKVETLKEQINAHMGDKFPRPVTVNDIADVVRTDSKQRYGIKGDLIRANQGHSVKTVNLGLTPIQPPKYLYHGTTPETVTLIVKTGLKAMSRNHVHLSQDYDTAVNVGSRHGKPQVLTVNAEQAHYDGIEFFQSKNGVWLVEQLPAKYVQL